MKKKMLAALLAVGLVFSLTACGEPGPDAVVKDTLTALKAGDSEKANANIWADDTSSESEEEQVFGGDDQPDVMFTALEYTILETKVDGSNATVKTEIKNKDLKKVTAEWMQAVLEMSIQDALSGDGTQMTEDELNKKSTEMLVKAIKEENGEKAAATIEIQLVKSDDGWLIKADDSFLDAVTGGMFRAVTDLTDSIADELEE